MNRPLLSALFSVCLALHAAETPIAPLDGSSLSSTFETGDVQNLPLHGWTAVSGTARVYDAANGALISQTPYGNYEVQHVTGTAVLPNTQYLLRVNMGFIAGLAGGSATYQLQLGTVNGGTFSPLGSTAGTVNYAGNIAFGTVSGMALLDVTTGPTVSGHPLAVRWAQTGTNGFPGSGTSDNFGIDNVTLTAVTTGPGDLDATFGSGGVVTTTISGTDAATAVAVQPDGKIVVAGNRETNPFDFALVRYTTSGVLDPTFGTDGKVIVDFGGFDTLTSMALQGDGKIVVVGYTFDLSGSNSFFAVARLTTTGALDPDFGTDGKVITSMNIGNPVAQSVALQNDGKIVVSGSTYSPSNFALVRYTTTGALDTTFDSDGRVTTDVSVQDNGSCLAIQVDGKILVGGDSGNGGSNKHCTLLRYNHDGALDTSFGTAGKVITNFGVGSAANAIVAHPNGKIILAGTVGDGSSNHTALACYDSSGALDTSFDGDGMVITPVGSASSGPRAMAVQFHEQKILVAGFAGDFFTPPSFSLVRYTIDGELDAGFGTGGKVIQNIGNSGALGMAVQGDGKIVLVGSSGGRFAVLRFLGDPPPPAGSLDSSFGSSGKVTTGIGQEDHGHSVALQGDGKIVVAGVSNSDFALVRHLADGTRDSSFGTAGRVTTNLQGDDIGQSVAVQSDGKILVAGSTTNPTPDFALVRYTAGGALDGSFGSGGIVTTDFGLTDAGKGVVIQSDGKTIVAGTTGVFPDANFALARYLADGTLDSSFGEGGKVITDFSGRFDQGASVALQSDGKIVVAGSSAGLTSEAAVARYNTNGTLDLSFGNAGKVMTDFGGGVEAIASSVVVQSDGKIVVAGSFDFVSFLLLRYHANGTPDSSFGSNGLTITSFGAGNAEGRSVALQSDGRIVVAGYHYNGSDHNFAVARYLANGAADTSFHTDGLVTTPIGLTTDIGNGVVVQSDGGIVVAGYSHNGTNNDFALVRYEGGAALPPEIDVQQPAATSIASGGGKDFGSVMVGAEADLTFTIANTGAGDLNLFGLPRVAVSGADAGLFTVTAQPAIVAGSGGATTFTVRFAPTSGGSKNATLLILSNDDSEPGYLINLTGAGLLVPEIDVQQPAGSSIASGGGKAFGGVNISSTADLTFTIANLGSGDLNLTGTPDRVVVSGTNADQFTVTAQPGSPVAPAGSTTFTVRFAPTSTGGKSAVLTIASNDNNEGAYTINLTGTGTLPEIDIQQPSGLSIASGGTRSFGGTLVNSTADLTFTIANTGDGALNLTGAPKVAVGGLDASLFTVTAQPASPVAPAGTTTFTVRFAPTSAGGKNATLSIASNDPDEGAYLINVTGFGTLPGDLDPGFGTGGTVVTSVGSGGGMATAMVVQSDGKILVAGAAVNATSDFALVRYHGDGTLDTAFGTGGKVTTDFASGGDFALGVALQNDGKIIVVGEAENGSNYDLAVARYTAAGVLDTAFGTGGKVLIDFDGDNDVARSVVVLSDNRIVVAGGTAIAGLRQIAVVRFTADGALDTTFNGTGKVTTATGNLADYGQSVALQSDGKIVVAGHSDTLTTRGITLVRYTTSGALDSSFGVDGIVVSHFPDTSQQASAVALQSDGKIVVTGYTSTDGGGQVALLRYTAGGVLDSSFGTGGRVVATINGGADPKGVVVQGDGRIVVAGSDLNPSGNYDFAVYRFNSNGAMDTTFGTGGAVLAPIGLADDFGNAVALQGTGKIVVAGVSFGESTSFALARIEAGPPALPEIDVQQPAGASIASGGSRAFGSIEVNSTADLTFTIANTGPGNLHLTGSPRAAVSGADAGLFTVTSQPAAVVSPSAVTTFTVRFAAATAGAKSATLTVASNDSDEGAYTIQLTGTGLTAQESWRLLYFATAANSGNAADDFDFDGDGLTNLVEFAFGLDPTQAASAQIPQAVLSGGNLSCTFTPPAGVNGITYGAEYSTTLLPGSWTSITNTGTPPQHLFAQPIGSNSRMFVRFKISSP